MRYLDLYYNLHTILRSHDNGYAVSSQLRQHLGEYCNLRTLENKYYLKLRYLTAFCNHDFQVFLKLKKDYFQTKIFKRRFITVLFLFLCLYIKLHAQTI